VVISGDMEKGGTNYRGAFWTNTISNGNVIFEDLEFRDFMLNTQDYDYVPIRIFRFTGTASGNNNNIEVIGCRFFNVNYFCINPAFGSSIIIIRNTHADNVAGLLDASGGNGHFIIDNVEIVSQIQGPSHYLPAIQLYGGAMEWMNTTTISNVTLQDCAMGLWLNQWHVIYNINNLKVRNVKPYSSIPGGNYYGRVITAGNVDSVHISNVDIDGVNGCSSALIFIHPTRTGHIVLDNVSIKNAPAPDFNAIIWFDANGSSIVEQNVLVNNCYLEASGTSSANWYFIDFLPNLTIKNTRFNFNNQNPNLGAVRSVNGFNLENVSFENSVSTTLLAIDGNYPYRLKRSGSFYNGASLSGDATFAELSGRVQSTGGAVLTGEP